MNSLLVKHTGSLARAHSYRLSILNRIQFADSSRGSAILIKCESPRYLSNGVSLAASKMEPSNGELAKEEPREVFGSLITEQRPEVTKRVIHTRERSLNMPPEVSESIKLQGKAAYFSKLSSTIDKLLETLKSEKVLVHDSDAKNFEKLIDRSQTPKVASAIQAIQNDKDFQSIQEYISNHEAYYAMDAKEKALLYRLSNTLKLFQRKYTYIILDSLYLNERFNKKLDLNDHLNYLKTYALHGKLPKYLLNSKSNSIDHVYKLFNEAINESSSQVVASECKDVAENPPVPEVEVDAIFKKVVDDQKFHALYSLIGYAKNFFTEEARTDLCQELLKNQRTILNSSVDSNVLFFLINNRLKNKSKYQDYTMDAKFDELFLKREQFIFENIDKISDAIVLKDFIELYQRMFLYKWNFSQERCERLTKLKNIFREKFCSQLLDSPNLQLDSIKTEMTILENFKLLEAKKTRETAKALTNSVESSPRRRTNRRNDRFQQDIAMPQLEETFFTKQDRKVLDETSDRFLENLKKIELIELNKSFDFLKSELKSSQKLFESPNKVIEENIANLCDPKTSSQLVELCSQLANEKKSYFRTQLANSILYDAYNRFIIDKRFFSTKLMYLFDNDEFLTEKLELIKPLMPELVENAMLDQLVQFLNKNKQFIQSMAINHASDYFNVTKAILKRLNSELEINDGSVLNYRIETDNLQPGELPQIDYNLLNQQLINKKHMKGLFDLIKIYESLNQNPIWQSVPSRGQIELDNSVLITGYRNALDNMIKMFNYLKHAKISMANEFDQGKSNKSNQKDKKRNKVDSAKGQEQELDQQYYLNGMNNYFLMHFDALVDQLRLYSQVYSLNNCHNAQQTVKLISYFNDLATVLLDRDMELFVNNQLRLVRMIRLFQVLSVFDVYPIANDSHIQKTIEFIQFKNSIYHMFESVKHKMSSRILIDVNYSMLNASIFNVNAVQALLSNNSVPTNLDRKLYGMSLKDKLFLINQMICVNHKEFKCDFAFQNYFYDYRLSDLESSKSLQSLHGFLKNLFGEQVVKVDPRYDFNLRANFELALDKNGNFLTPSDPNKVFRLPIIFSEDHMTYYDKSNSESSNSEDDTKFKSPYSTLNNLLGTLYPVTIIKQSKLRETKTDAEKYEYIKQVIVKSLKKLIVT